MVKLTELKRWHIVVGIVVVVVLSWGTYRLAMWSYREDLQHKYRDISIAMTKARYRCADVKVVHNREGFVQVQGCGQQYWYRCSDKFLDVECDEIKPAESK